MNRKPNPEYVCPHCNREVELDTPDDDGVESEGYFYKWTCPKCGESFTQWYDLVWSENIKE